MKRELNPQESDVTVGYVETKRKNFFKCLGICELFGLPGEFLVQFGCYRVVGSL